MQVAKYETVRRETGGPFRGEDLAIERPQKQPQQSDDVVVIIGNQQDRAVGHYGLILAQSRPEGKRVVAGFSRRGRAGRLKPASTLTLPPA